MTSPRITKRPTVTLEDFLGEINFGYTVKRINDSEFRVDDQDGKKLVSGFPSDLARWALKLRRGRAQVHVILECVRVFESSERPLERLEIAVNHFHELGVEPYEFVKGEVEP